MSETAIVNSALIKLGERTINSLDQDNKAARIAKIQYPVLRDEVLYSHPWNFSIKRAVLSANATAPDFGFDIAYDLPSDVLRVLHPLTFEDSIPISVKWQKEGNQILTNEPEFKIRYIGKITDTSKFSAAFKETLAFRLAADFAYSIANSRVLSQHYFGIFQQHLAQSRSFDAQEGSAEQLTADLWINSRSTGVV